ncbi:chondroitin sulfate proteoglycan 4-like [Salvelinus alpinus]|uniref:chondroitin sulfate proteoglycan 4-like n=1 Tax=Salvelinus alpinus TaxID=8036 RepID=UPI0039FDB612
MSHIYFHLHIIQGHHSTLLHRYNCVTITSRCVLCYAMFCQGLYLSPIQVWVNSVTEICVDDLSVEDSAFPPEDLEFIETPPNNRHRALKSSPFRHILNFTQTHILWGQLVFVHSGALSGGFHFQVNDGVNFTPVRSSVVLSLESNHALTVFPGSVKINSQNELLVVTNDNGDIRGDHSILYSVTSPPKLGRLVRKQTGNSTAEISSTKNMVCI